MANTNEVKKIIERHGGTNIRSYSLVNNYGYTFALGGVACDMRFWANCYGVALNCWRIQTFQILSDDQRAIIKSIEDEANA